MTTEYGVRWKYDENKGSFDAWNYTRDGAVATFRASNTKAHRPRAIAVIARVVGEVVVVDASGTPASGVTE